MPEDKGETVEHDDRHAVVISIVSRRLEGVLALHFFQARHLVYHYPCRVIICVVTEWTHYLIFACCAWISGSHADALGLYLIIAMSFQGVEMAARWCGLCLNGFCPVVRS